MKEFGIGPRGLEVRTFRTKPVTQWMLAIDRKIWLRWLNPKERISCGIQWIHKRVNAWEDVFEGSYVAKGQAKDFDLFSLTANWFWMAGNLNPMLVVFFSPEGGGKGGGTWMTQPSISYNIDPHWYCKLTMQAFWGNRKAKSGYAGLINTSELTFKLGYQW